MNCTRCRNGHPFPLCPDPKLSLSCLYGRKTCKCGTCNLVWLEYTMYELTRFLMDPKTADLIRDLGDQFATVLKGVKGR